MLASVSMSDPLPGKRGSFSVRNGSREGRSAPWSVDPVPRRISSAAAPYPSEAARPGHKQMSAG